MKILLELHVQILSVLVFCPRVCVRVLSFKMCSLVQSSVCSLTCVLVFVSSVIMYSSLPGVDVAHKLHWIPGETVGLFALKPNLLLCLSQVHSRQD